MSTVVEQNVRKLDPSEIDSVAGGAGSLNAVFKYGDLVIEMYADASCYSVATTNTTTGKSVTKTHYTTD